jgi:hypothetical protein
MTSENTIAASEIEHFFPRTDKPSEQRAALGFEERESKTVLLSMMVPI